MPATPANWSTLSGEAKLLRMTATARHAVSVAVGDAEIADIAAVPAGEQPEMELPDELSLQDGNRVRAVEEPHQAQGRVAHLRFGRLDTDGRARGGRRRPHVDEQTLDYRRVEIDHDREIGGADVGACDLADRRHVRRNQERVPGAEVESAAAHQHPLRALQH